MITVGNYQYSNQDAKNTFRNLGDLWREVAAGRDPVVVRADGEELATYLTNALGAEFSSEPLQTRLADLGMKAMAAFGTPGWEPRVVDRHVGHVMRGLSRAMGALRAAGELPDTQVGRVLQLSTSMGGVPKTPREVVDITYSGVRGDVQGSRQHHGRPWQALCIWSREVIDAFAAEGHNLAPGHAGENITVEGLRWEDVRPGVRLRMGNVLAEVWAFAVPCHHQAQWFADADFSRLHHDNGPVSRVYALVLETGRVTVGDAIVLEP
jgi:MOSC domain-containing protein YiiM